MHATSINLATYWCKVIICLFLCLYLVCIFSSLCIIIIICFFYMQWLEIVECNNIFLFHFWHLAHLTLVSHLEGPLISLSCLTNNTQNKIWISLNEAMKARNWRIRMSKISNMSLLVNNKNFKRFCEYEKNKTYTFFPNKLNVTSVTLRFKKTNTVILSMI